jgi:hypothetical protein
MDLEVGEEDTDENRDTERCIWGRYFGTAFFEPEHAPEFQSWIYYWSFCLVSACVGLR